MDRSVAVPQIGDLRGRRIDAKRRSWPRQSNRLNPRYSKRAASLDLPGDDDDEAGVSGDVAGQAEYEAVQRGANTPALAAPARDTAARVAMPRLHPPYLLLLGVATFILYTALYLVDCVLIYLTFVPGVLLKEATASFPAAIRSYFRTNDRDLLEALRDLSDMSTMIPSSWHASMWSTYAVGPGFRYIDTFLALSLALDIAAFSTAVLLILCMWYPGRVFQLPKIGWERRNFGLPSPWNALGNFVAGVILLAYMTVPLEDATRIRISFWVILAILFAYVTDANNFFTAMIPRSCQLQLAVSVYRMRPLDPYHHQIHTYLGIVQLFLLAKMLGHARRAGEYYYRYITNYVDRRLRERR